MISHDLPIRSAQRQSDAAKLVRPPGCDINALSNFVADAPRVIGFDPVQNLADFLEKELNDVL